MPPFGAGVDSDEACIYETARLRQGLELKLAGRALKLAGEWMHETKS